MQTVILRNDNDREWTTLEKIRVELVKRGITQKVDIEEEAEELILNTLMRDDIDKVYVEEDGALIIEYLEENPNGEEIKDNYNGTIRN
jgi:hypothetical protein